MEDSESEYEEEEVVILVELNGIIDTNFLLEKPEPTKILGIETERPILQLGHYIFAGEYEDTLGTLVAFKPLEKKNETEQTEYKYCYKTDKKLSMKRIFLQEKGIDLNAKELTAEELQNLASPENRGIDDENSCSSTKDVKSLAIDNGFAEAVSNIHYPDMDIVKAMEFCVETATHLIDNTSIESIYANGILSESSNIVNNLIVHQNSPENTLSTVENSVINLDETYLTEVKNLNDFPERITDLISNDTDLKNTFPVQYPSPINPPKQGIKRRRPSDNDNFSDNDNELKIAREITDNIIESVAVNEDKLSTNLESEPTNETEVNNPFEVQHVLEGINSIVEGSSPEVAYGILNSQLIVTDVEDSNNVPEVSTIGSFLQNSQNYRIDNSLEVSGEIISNFVSLIHEENSDNLLSNTSDPPVGNSTVSVGTTYSPLYQDQDVESSTDKVKSPIPHQESEIVDENKCSSSGDMKVLGHENRLSSEISQSSDLISSAISIGGEVSQSSKNSASDIAVSSESVGHTSSRYHGDGEEDIDMASEPHSFDQASSGPCISSDDIELNGQDASMSCETELENNQGSSQCEVSQSKNGGSTYADSMGNDSNDSNECDACGQSDDPTSLLASNLIEDEKNACASSVLDVCGQSDDPANEASSPTLIGDVRNPCASSDVCGQSDDSAYEVSPTLSGHLKNICASSVSVCGQSDDTAYEEVENACASSDICGQSDDLAYEVENPCASSDVCGQSDDSVYEDVKNPCASSDVCGQSDDPTYEEVKEPCASSNVCGQSDDQIYEASSPNLNDRIINPCASSDVCGQSDDPAYETVSPSFHAEVNPCASSYVCGQSDDQVYEASSPNGNDEIINPGEAYEEVAYEEVENPCASSNICGQSDDLAYEVENPCASSDVCGQSDDSVYEEVKEPCASSDVCGQSDNLDFAEVENPCASSDICGQSDDLAYEVENPCASSDICGQSDDPTYEEVKEPCASSNVCGQSDNLDFAEVENPCASSNVCGQSDDQVYEASSPNLNDKVINPCASSDVCGQSDDPAYETISPSFHDEVNPCASSYVCGQSDDQVYEASSPNENDEVIDPCASSNVCGQSDDPAYEATSPSLTNDVSPCAPSDVCGQSHDPDQKASSPTLNEDIQNPCASSNDCGQSDVPAYEAPSPSLNEDIRYPCASSDVCGQSDDPTYESTPVIVSEDIKNPCASSDICGQSDEISHEGPPPVLNEHNRDPCASSMPDICEQSDVSSHEASLITGSENRKNPCVSSDDVIVDNSEASENEQEVKNSLCEVSQSSKIQNDDQKIHDGNISYEYDLKDTNECEVYDQSSENAFDLSVHRTHAHEELRDPCASSDDVQDNFHEVSLGDQARGRSKLSSSGCEVTQSSKFEDNIAVVPDIQQSFEDSGDSNECEDVKPKRTICKATQSSRFDAGPSSAYEPFSENRESSNECEDTVSQNFSCEVTQSSKFEVEEETYIILDEDNSSEYEERSIGCEREISQSFTSGDARLVPADEDQCSNPYDDTSSRSFTCEVTQSFRSGDDAFVVPESQVQEEISSEHGNQFSSPVCEVSQSFRPEIQNIVHDVESLIDDRDDLNECEVYEESLHSSNELNDYSRGSKDPCESSDDVQLRAITPSKTSIEGECSSSSKIAPSVPVDEDQSSSIDDSFPNPDGSVVDQSVNDLSTKDQEGSFVGDLKLNCESSTPSTSMVNVSSSSSVRSSHAVYSSPGIISGSSEMNIQAVIDVDESPVQLSSSGNIRNPVDGDNFIDSSSSSSSVELIGYHDVDLLPSESTDAVTNAISPIINNPMIDSPVGSSVTQSLVPNTNVRLNSAVHLVQGSDDSNDIIEVVESSTSVNSRREFHNQAESSNSKIDQVEDEEVQILDSVQGSSNKEKCSSSNTTSVCTSGKSTSGPLFGNEASSSKHGDPYEFSDVMDAEIEICDSEEENSEKYHMSVNSSNEASSSQLEMQDNMPSLLEVIVSSASDFRNSLIHESSGFVRNNSRNLLIGEVTESSSINIHTESQQESLTNEAVGFSHGESEKSVSQPHHYFIDPNNTDDLGCAETEVTESCDKMNPELGCSSYASKEQQVSQSSEIENTDSSSNRTEFPISSDLPEGTLQRDFVQSSTNISNVSTMSVSSDSFGLAEQVTSAEESMPTDHFYEPLPHEVPGSSSNDIVIMSEVMACDIQSGSNVIQSSNQNPTLFEANLSMYQKIEAVDPEVSSSPCNEHVQICSIADTDKISEVEIQPSDIRGSLLIAEKTESGEVAPSAANSELCSAPLLLSAIVEVGESSACEVTASHIVKAIPSHEVLDSSGNAEGNTVSCEVTESSSRNQRVASQKTDLEAEGSSSCSVIGSTTGAKRYEYDSSSSSSSSYSIVEVDYDAESKSSANEAEVLSPDLIIETNDSESVINDDEAACDLYICESSKSSENNSKNSSICEVTESCTAELNESSESFTNESKVSSCSASASTSVQQTDTGLYNENEFSALSSHEAVAKSYDMLPVEQPQAPNNQQSQMEAVSQSTSSAVELSMYEHVADFESDSVQSSSFEATQFSVNEQIKAISSPPQFSDSSSDNDQPKINTNPFIAPDGEYMTSENCDLSVLGGIPSLPSSRISHTSPFQVCPFPNLMSTATDTSLFKVDPGTTMPVVSLPPFNISTPTTSSFVNIASGSAGNESFGASVDAVEPSEVPFLALPQGVYQYEVEVQESLPMEIVNPPYEGLIHSSEDVLDAVADDNDVPSDDFKLPSSTSH